MGIIQSFLLDIPAGLSSGFTPQIPSGDFSRNYYLHSSRNFSLVHPEPTFRRYLQEFILTIHPGILSCDSSWNFFFWFHKEFRPGCLQKFLLGFIEELFFFVFFLKTPAGIPSRNFPNNFIWRFLLKLCRIPVVISSEWSSGNSFMGLHQTFFFPEIYPGNPLGDSSWNAKISQEFFFFKESLHKFFQGILYGDTSKNSFRVSFTLSFQKLLLEIYAGVPSRTSSRNSFCGCLQKLILGIPPRIP